MVKLAKRWLFSAVVLVALWSGASAHASRWSAPLRLSDGPSAEDPSVAVARGGRAIVAWARHYDGHTRSVEARVSDGKAFGEVLVLSEPFRTDPYVYADNMEPSVAMDDDGRAVVAWEYEGSIRTRVIEPGAAAPAPPETLSASRVQSSRPQVAFDGDGWATVFWKDSYPGGVFAATRAPGGHFGPEQVLFTPTEYDRADDLDYAVSPETSVAVWRTRWKVMLALRVGRGAFSAPRTLKAYDPEEQITPLLPRAVVDRDGDVLVTWNDDLDGWRTWAALRPAGGDFEAPVLIAENGWNADARPFFDSAGRAMIVGAHREQLVRQWRRDDGGWGAPQSVVDGFRSYGFIESALGADDNLYFAWRDYYGDYVGRAWAAVVPWDATAPTAPVAVSGDGENVWPAALAAGPDARALVTWSRGTFPGGFHAEAAWWHAPDPQSPDPLPNGVAEVLPGPAHDPDTSGAGVAQGVGSQRAAAGSRADRARQLARSLARRLARLMSTSRLRALKRPLAGRREMASATATATVVVRIPRRTSSRAIAKIAITGTSRRRWRLTAVAPAIVRRMRSARRKLQIGVRVTVTSPTGRSATAERWAAPTRSTAR